MHSMHTCLPGLQLFACRYSLVAQDLRQNTTKMHAHSHTCAHTHKHTCWRAAGKAWRVLVPVQCFLHQTQLGHKPHCHGNAELLCWKNLPHIPNKDSSELQVHSTQKWLTPFKSSWQRGRKLIKQTTPNWKDRYASLVCLSGEFYYYTPHSDIPSHTIQWYTITHHTVIQHDTTHIGCTRSHARPLAWWQMLSMGLNRLLRAYAWHMSDE